MGAMCKRVDFPRGALEAEAKATEAGLLLAWDLGLKDIVMEGDSQLVIQALNDSIPPALPILKIVEGMKRLLVHFSYWKAMHTRRNANVAAHLVTRLRFFIHGFHFFFFSFQPAIVDFVNCKQYIYVLFTVPQITLFSNFFIKNGSHNTIHTFKNYFVTVFSV